MRSNQATTRQRLGERVTRATRAALVTTWAPNAASRACAGALRHANSTPTCTLRGCAHSGGQRGDAPPSGREPRESFGGRASGPAARRPATALQPRTRPGALPPGAWPLARAPIGGAVPVRGDDDTSRSARRLAGRPASLQGGQQPEQPPSPLASSQQAGTTLQPQMSRELGTSLEPRMGGRDPQRSLPPPHCRLHVTRATPGAMRAEVPAARASRQVNTYLDLPQCM